MAPYCHLARRLLAGRDVLAGGVGSLVSAQGPRGPRGYTGSSGSRLAVAGYLVLAIGVVLGLYFTVQNTHKITSERADRFRNLSDYLARSCARDKDKDAIFISILANAAKQTRVSGLTPRVRQLSVHNLETAIKGIEEIDANCLTDIPSPISKH